MVELRRRPDQTEEEFLDEVDPYGDRFGTAIPLWGCLLAVALMLGAIYGIYRLL